MERQIGVAEQSSQAAKESAEAAKRSIDALVSGERAWVLVTPDQESRLVPVTSGTPVPYNLFRFTIENKGKTVARMVRIQSSGFLAQRGQTLDETPTYGPHESANFSPGDTVEIINAGVFAPGVPNPMSVTINLLLSADDIFRMSPGGDLVFYMFGRIEYFDFAETERVIQFCYRYTGDYKDLTTGEVVRGVLDGPPAYNTHS